MNSNNMQNLQQPVNLEQKKSPLRRRKVRFLDEAPDVFPLDRKDEQREETATGYISAIKKQNLTFSNRHIGLYKCESNAAVIFRRRSWAATMEYSTQPPTSLVRPPNMPIRKLSASHTTSFEEEDDDGCSYSHFTATRPALNGKLNNCEKRDGFQCKYKDKYQLLDQQDCSFAGRLDLPDQPKRKLTPFPGSFTTGKQESSIL